MNDSAQTALDPQATAGVAVPPPLLFATGLTVGLLAGRAPLDDATKRQIARTVGIASVIFGCAVGAAAIAQLKRAGTNLDPYKPTTALTTQGVFALSRNPAYFGATSIYVGIAMAARSLPAFVALPIVLALLDRLVVRREERYLQARFGDAYRAYYERVPRWF